MSKQKRTTNDEPVANDEVLLASDVDPIRAALASPVFEADRDSGNDAAALTIIKSSQANALSSGNASIAKAIGSASDDDDEDDGDPISEDEANAESNGSTDETESDDEESEEGGEKQEAEPVSVVDMLLVQHNEYMKVGNYDAAQMIVAAIQNIQNAALDEQIDENGGDGDEEIPENDETESDGDVAEDEVGEPADADEEIEMAASKVTKSGRALSNKNAEALQAAHDHIVKVAKASGMTLRKADEAMPLSSSDGNSENDGPTYTTSNTLPNKQPAPSPKKKPVKKAATSPDNGLLPALQEITKSLQAMNSRIAAIESRPRGNGPIINGTAVEKSLGVSRTSVDQDASESPVVKLRKAYEVEANPAKKQDLATQIADYELRAALSTPRGVISRY